jgi:triosephosphate isomerase (TIM)
MRTPLIAGNWKMNLDGAQAELLARTLSQRIGQQQAVDILVCPPFPYLPRVGTALSGSKIALGAQNCHNEWQGAFTGEVSPKMLVDCGCTWVIVGHSERRHGKPQEKDDFIHKKIVGARAAGLQVIVCIGESEAERRANQTQSVVESQLIGSLESLPVDQIARIAVAYEPVWAIGTGVNATPDQAEEVHHFIRTWLDDHFGADVAEATRILYGGSVTPANAAGLLTKPNVDGALVGGASLKADDFVGIVNAAPASS